MPARVIICQSSSSEFNSTSSLYDNNNRFHPPTPNEILQNPRHHSARSKSGKIPKSPRLTRSIILFGTVVGNKNRGDNISKTDISASPRLVGYSSTFVSSLVLLVSVLKLWFFETFPINLPTPIAKSLDHTYTYYSYKLYGAVAFAAFCVGTSFLIICFHFDRAFLPDFWKSIFKDGSKAERNLLLFLMTCSIVGIHMCTSVFGPGSREPNVYFSAWLCFSALFYTFDIWRITADLPSIFLTIYRHRHKSLKYWFVILTSSLVSAISLIELYVEVHKEDNQMLRLKFASGMLANGQNLTNERLQWIVSISYTGMTFMISLGAIIFQARWSNHIRRSLWAVEGVLLFLLCIVWTFGLLRYTNGPFLYSVATNLYFGLWLTFLGLTTGFATWYENINKVDPELEEEEEEGEGDDHA